MATGDITAVRINAEGWYAEVDIEGLDTGGTYDFGLGTNNSLLSPKMSFTVTSSGYDDSGTLGTMTRTVYGTYRKRQVYPNNALADETDNTTYVTVRVALSDWVYADDTATVNIVSGFYNDGTNGSNAASSVSVTNNSAEDYPKVIANWSLPGFDRLTGSTFKLRCVAFHRSARQGKPVKCVKFTATDEHSNTVTTTITAPTIDSSIPDAMPVVEYIGELSTSTLTQGDIITCNFIAYPWYGDAGSIINTGDAVNTMPTPLYAPQYYLCDKTGAYGSTVAVVDSVSGDNGTGAVVDSASFNSESPPNAYRNIYAAANAIATYNNTNHSRNNCAAGIIYLKEGAHVWTGGTVSAGGQASGPCWCTVTKFPGATRDNVTISTASGTKQIGEKLKIDSVYINNSTAVGFTAMDYVWMTGCKLKSTGLATFNENKCLYFTHSDLGNCAEYKQFGTGNFTKSIIRGCQTYETITNGFQWYTFIGNKLVLGATIQNSYSGQTAPALTNMVIAYNRVEQTTDKQLVVITGTNSLISHNTAMVQNLFIKTAAEGTGPLVWIHGDATTTSIHNVLLCYNSFLGQRNNQAYNDYNLNGVGPVYHNHWTSIGNVYEDMNTVTDYEPHGGTAGAERYGNHAIRHGVSFIGNVTLNRVGIEDYEIEFGLYYARGTSNATPLVPNFLDDKTNTATGGDYRPTASTPFLSFIPSGMAVLPYDIAGVARRDDGTGCIGAYEYQSVVKIPMMMRHFAARRR